MRKLIALLVTASGAASAYAAEFTDISINEVKTLTESKSAVILDVNGDESFKAGHVPGALNFAAIKDNLDRSLPKKKDALIIAYCGNPKCGAYLRAAKAAQKLGYTNIKHMSAGISGWKEAGMKTEPGS
jgi:rhodanese-related sulfurtransferase